MTTNARGATAETGVNEVICGIHYKTAVTKK